MIKQYKNNSEINFNIFGVHWKIRLLRGGGVGVLKNQYIGGIAKKGGLGQFVDLRGGGGLEFQGT